MDKKTVSNCFFGMQIQFAFDDINYNYHLYSTKTEKVRWFIQAMNRFENLSEIYCHEPAGEDAKRYKEVFDLFSTHCHENLPVWLDALLEVGNITEDQHRASMFIGKLVSQDTMNAELSDKINQLSDKIVEIVNITRKIENLQKTINSLKSALNFYSGNATEFTKRRWRQMLASREKNLNEILTIADILRSEVDLLIKQ